MPRSARRRRPARQRRRTSCACARCSCRRCSGWAAWTRRSASPRIRWGRPRRIGDEALTGEALHRLAQTLLAPRPKDAVELLLRLVALARRRKDPVLEARAFLGLGVARMRTRDDLAGGGGVPSRAAHRARRAGARRRGDVVDEPRRDRAAARRLRRRRTARSTRRCACTRRCATTRVASARCTTWRCWRRERGDLDGGRRALSRDRVGRRAARRRRASRSARMRARADGAPAAGRRRGAHGARDGAAHPRHARRLVVPGARAAGVARRSGSRCSTATKTIALTRFRMALETTRADRRLRCGVAARGLRRRAGGAMTRRSGRRGCASPRTRPCKQFVPLAARFTALRDFANRLPIGASAARARPSRRARRADD